MSRWLQLIKSSPLAKRSGQWRHRLLSVAPDSLADDIGETDEIVEEGHGYTTKPAISPYRKGNNWNYRTELSALAVRLGYDVESLPSLVKALQQEGQPRHKGDQIFVKPNRLSVLGRSTLLHYVNEYVYFTYPEMGGSMLTDISTYLTDHDALVKLANHFGVSDLIRTKVDLSSGSSMYIISQSFCATVGAVYQDQGPKAAKKLVHDIVITQLSGLDIQEVVKFQHPRFMLRTILSSQGRPKPVSRLISESGRATHFPSFVVGVFSGDNCLGEGTGTSLRRAELEAINTALRTHFQKELSVSPLPSDLEDFVAESELKEKVLPNMSN